MCRCRELLVVQYTMHLGCICIPPSGGVETVKPFAILPTVHNQCGTVLASSRVPRHASNTGLISAAQPGIVGVNLFTHNTQVAGAVVTNVPVDVVHYTPFWNIHPKKFARRNVGARPTWEYQIPVWSCVPCWAANLCSVTYNLHPDEISGIRVVLYYTTCRSRPVAWV